MLRWPETAAFHVSSSRHTCTSSHTTTLKCLPCSDASPYGYTCISWPVSRLTMKSLYGFQLALSSSLEPIIVAMYFLTMRAFSLVSATQPYWPFGTGFITASLRMIAAATSDLPKPRHRPRHTRLYFRRNVPSGSSRPLAKIGRQMFSRIQSSSRYGLPAFASLPACVR